MVSAGGYQCFLSTILTLLDERYDKQLYELIYCKTWRQSFMYDLYEVQNIVINLLNNNIDIDFVNKNISSYGVKLIQVADNDWVKNIEQYIVGGEPILIKHKDNDRYMIIVDVDNDFVAAKDNECVKFIEKQEIVEYNSWKLVVSCQLGDIKLNFSVIESN